MNRKICLAAFLAGLIAVAWVGAGYLGAHPLALVMTLLIGATYVFGALELRRFDQATGALERALAAIPENLSSLGDWLGQLPPSLQNAVRLRIEGERVGLPGPALTPYLVGLLVMLGMLGTFLGMVVTLNGAVIALESTPDLATIRAALAAPVKGLGLAFGTSVAGVAASAMLGLISSLCRRERLQAAQLLDSRIATSLRGFSLVHQRQETFRALQFQAQAMPEVVDKLQAMMDQIEQRNEQLNERLLASQERFYAEVRGVYTGLAGAVDQSLRSSLSESARLAGAALQPVVETTLAGIARETTALHQNVTSSLSAQLDGLSARFEQSVGTVADTWTAALARHEASSATLNAGVAQAQQAFAETFAERSAALLAGVGQAHAALQAELAARDEARLAALTGSVQAMAATLQREWQLAGEQNQAQQERICRTLEETGREITAQVHTRTGETSREIAGFMQAAAEAPRAAAEVIGQLRQELSSSIARDNSLLEERSRIMETLNTLLGAINHASVEQRGLIDALVSNSAAVLDRVGARFSEEVESGTSRLGEHATQIAGSAAEVSSLGDAFAFAVQQFSAANEKMIASLERIEGALDKSVARSDQQLGYYVAQAREIIDLSIMSQKKMVDEMQRLSVARVARADLAEPVT